jgi:PIN like domain
MQGRASPNLRKTTVCGRLRLKKLFKNTQQLEPPVFFLDRNLGLRLAAIFRRASFTVIAHQEHYGPGAQGVSDPEVISECGRLKHALLTADGNLPFTFATEIRNARIAVFLLFNNHEGPEVWGPRVISAKLDMEREWYGESKALYRAHQSRGSCELRHAVLSEKTEKDIIKEARPS